MTKIEIKKAFRDFYKEIEDKRLFNEKYIFGIKENFDTALWFFHEGVNYIQVGDRALESFSNDVTLKEKLLEHLLYHEFGHSLYTTRNKNIGTILASSNIPFPMWNLFEDIRMEKFVEKNLSYLFNYSLYMKELTEDFNPEGILFNLLYFGSPNDDMKNEFIESYNVKNPEAERSGSEIYNRVIDFYYPKIIEAESSEDLIYLITLWIKEFYPEKEDEKKSSEEKLEDALNALDKLLKELNEEGLSHDLKILSDEEKKNLIETMEILLDSSEEDEKIEVEINQKNHQEDEGEYTEGSFQCCNTTNISDTNLESSFLNDYNFSFNDGEKYDRKKANKLLPVFSKILNSKAINVPTRKPSKRLHGRNLANGREKVYKRKESLSKRTKTISIVLDCSGSMYLVMNEMKLIIGLCNQLAISNQISGNLILSSSFGYETISLPMKDSDIDKINALPASEGLQNTMKENLQVLKKSDYVFVLTDGDIADDEIDKPYFRKHKVNTIGMYIGDRKYLNKWFEKAIARKTIESLIDQLLRIIK